MRCSALKEFLAFPDFSLNAVLRFLVAAVVAFPAFAQETRPLETFHLYCAPEIRKSCTPAGDDQTRDYEPAYSNQWPTRTIPLVFKSEISSDAPLMSAIKNAFEHVTKTTGVSFLQCDSARLEKDRIPFIYVSNRDRFARPNCSATTGYNPRPRATAVNASQPDIGRAMIMSLDRPLVCDENNPGVIVHEILHSLGMVHAHANPDRFENNGEYILEKNQAANLDLRRPSNSQLRFGQIGFEQHYFGDYDYYSATHYDCTRFEQGPNFRLLSKTLETRWGLEPSLPNVTGRSCLAQSDLRPKCVSVFDAQMLDQAYGSGSEPPCDRFGVLDLVSEGVCKRL